MAARLAAVLVAVVLWYNYLQANIMIIRYSLDSQEIDISASKVELLYLAECFSRGEGSISSEQGISSYPYKKLALCLEIQNIRESLVCFNVLQDNILVQGDLRKLLVISENILGLANGGSGQHTHIDYFEEHPYLCAESMPIVISCI
jgi:hypothetical protein